MYSKYSKYTLPFKKNVRIKICDASSHRKRRASRFCLDFFVPSGTPIVAARDGVVVARESRYSKSYKNERYLGRANYVILRHSDGEESVYVHLRWRSIKVKIGQKVKRGQFLALSGQTGYATYPHLHFGVYKDEENIKVVFRRHRK